MSLASMVRRPEWREAPFEYSARVLLSLVRRRIPSLAMPVVNFDRGRSKVVADLTTSQGLLLFRCGNRLDDPELSLIHALLKPGDAFVDVGANVGLYSLVAAASVGPGGHVIACEPSPRVLGLLRRNAELSGFSWLQALQTAVSDTTGYAAFCIFDGDAAAMSSFAPESTAGSREEVVATTTLDEAIPLELAARVVMVKIDAEGSEVRVLRGATDLLARSSPHILIEVAAGHLSRQGTSIEELRELVVAAGYRSYRVDPGGPPIRLREELDWCRAAETPNMFLTCRPEELAACGVQFVGS